MASADELGKELIGLLGQHTFDVDHRHREARRLLKEGAPVDYLCDVREQKRRHPAHRAKKRRMAWEEVAHARVPPAPLSRRRRRLSLARGLFSLSRPAPLSLSLSLCTKIGNFFSGQINSTPLIEATKQGDEYIMKLLLEAGAETEPKGIGDSPLMIAANGGKEAMVRLLLAAGADREYRVGGIREEHGKVGNTALDLAKKGGHTSVVALLEAPLTLDLDKRERALARKA